MKHLTIGGSSFARTLACPGWIKASAKLPKGTPSPAAVRGSMHHMVQEACHVDEKTPEDCLGMVYKEGDAELAFTEDELDDADIIFNNTNKFLDDLDIDEFMVEPFVQLIPNEAGGSLDLLGLSSNGKTLALLDIKTGQIVISPVENAQLLFYGVSAEEDPLTKDMFRDVEKIVFAIVQPTARGVVSTWECDRKTLVKFRKEALEAIKKTKHKTPALNAGPECKYCPAASYCKVNRANAVATRNLTPTHKAELQASADLLPVVEAWVNSVKQELFTQLTRGASVKGWKIVDKRANRKWVDEAAAEAALKKAKLSPVLYIKSALMTAPQVTSAIKKAKLDLEALKKKFNFDLDDLIEAKSSGTTLAPEDDDREAVATGGVPENLSKLVGKK